MKIFTVCFKYLDRPEYKILLEVFRRSCRYYMPDVEFIAVEPIPPPYESDRIPGFLDNTFKLKIWMDFFKRTNDNIIFADCDMLTIRTAYHAFDPDFDIAVTDIQQPYKAKINGGIFMTKPTRGAYRFLQELIGINDHMYQNICFHEYWRVKKGYAGMNQAAMGCILETGINGAKVHHYMTREWNAIDRDLPNMNGNTVFVHMKSKIRQMVLHGEILAGVFKMPMQEWYKFKNMKG